MADKLHLYNSNSYHLLFKPTFRYSTFVFIFNFSFSIKHLYQADSSLLPCLHKCFNVGCNFNLELMLKEDILKFIVDNQHDKLMDFYNKTYDKLKELNQKIDKLSFWLVVIVLLYFVVSKATVSSFSIGPISISDITLIPKFIPVVFGEILLDLVITSGHKAELQTTVKFIFLSIYKQDVKPKDLEDGKLTLFARILMPFSYSSELLKFNADNVSAVSGCFGAILFAPLLLFILLPFYFEYYMLRDIYHNYYSTAIGKFSFYFSIWLMLTVIYYYINTTIIAFKNKKAGKI